jgi:hypothetical protein
MLTKSGNISEEKYKNTLEELTRIKIENGELMTTIKTL